MTFQNPLRALWVTRVLHVAVFCHIAVGNEGHPASLPSEVIDISRPHRAKLLGEFLDGLSEVFRVKNGGIELSHVRISGVEERLSLVGHEWDVAVLVNRAVVLGDRILVLSCRLASGNARK